MSSFEWIWIRLQILSVLCKSMKIKKVLPTMHLLVLSEFLLFIEHSQVIRFIHQNEMFSQAHTVFFFFFSSYLKFSLSLSIQFDRYAYAWKISRLVPYLMMVCATGIRAQKYFTLLAQMVTWHFLHDFLLIIIYFVN